MNKISKNKKGITILIFNFIIMGIICILLYKPLKNILSNPYILKEQLTNLGNWGLIFIILIMSLQIVFVFLPGEVIEIAAGFSYGTFGGMILCLLGAIIGTIIIYGIVNKYGIKFVNKFYDTKKFNQISFLKKEKNLEFIIFIIFFIPGTPKDILTYLAPFTRLKLSTFILITTIARIPSIITSTIAGNALVNQDYNFTIIVFAITGFISILGLLCYKHYINQKNL